jgi:hypothetical protein
MLRPLFGILDERDLERQLLRQSVGELTACRHSCVDCGRTPLIGERVHRYPRGETVCALCRPARTSDPVTTDTVRHSERGHSVRVRPRSAAA